MLIALAIRDVVLIERLELSFAPGLSALTGETGAGKSILLDALGLALGGRGDSSLVRAGAAQAVVTAEFALPPTHPALALLHEQGLEAAPELVLRRLLGRDGRSRAFVNDQPIGISLLRQLGESLVEIHGQFETHGLLNPQTHRDVLDAFASHRQADHEVLQQQTAKAYAAWRAAEAARETALLEAARARSEEDYLRHALADLDDLAPTAGEEEELASRRALLMHSGKIAEAVSAALGEIAGERGADHAIGAAHRGLLRVAAQAEGRLDQALTALDRASAEIEEACVQLQSQLANLEQPEDSLEQVDERLYRLRATARRLSVDVEGLPALRQDLARRLALIEDQGDVLVALARAAEQQRALYIAAAEALGASRRAAAAALDTAVETELPPLKLERASFMTQVEPLAPDDWGVSGQERVTFTVATNPGAPPGPLSRIASGGELARFMLALKVVLAGLGSVPTLVFDEVDTGIGGAVAAAVGERLARLGKLLQVLVVTHSPQVAARGSQHLRVQKRLQGEVTLTEVAELTTPEARREEIARMLSGAQITNEARAAADSLLAGG